MKIAATLICTCCVLSSLWVAQPKDWYGISPLRSRRNEVEQRLGVAASGCECFYETPKERISIKYSTGDCASKNSNGWDVPQGIVISLLVFPKYKIAFSSLNVDEKEFTKTEDDELAGAFTYANKEKGIQIHVENDLATSFFYGPTAADAGLRCSEQRNDGPQSGLWTDGRTRQTIP